MLQPRQLREVSAQYPEQIEEVRDFLIKAGIPVDTPEALADIAARLTRERAFHRDLTSNIWVVLDRSGQRISYSDLLGIVAVAASGTLHAATAHEDAAHDLLRFLMQARHALEAVSLPTTTTPQTAPGHAPASSQRSPMQTATGAPAEFVSPLSRETGRGAAPAPAAPVASVPTSRRSSNLSAALAAASSGPMAAVPTAPVPVAPMPVTPQAAAATSSGNSEPSLPVPVVAAPAEAVVAEAMPPAVPEPGWEETRWEEPGLHAGTPDAAPAWHGRIAWAVALACIVALAVGAWRLHRPAKSEPNVPAPVVDGPSSAESSPVISAQPSGNAVSSNPATRGDLAVNRSRETLPRSTPLSGGTAHRQPTDAAASHIARTRAATPAYAAGDAGPYPARPATDIANAAPATSYPAARALPSGTVVPGVVTPSGTAASIVRSTPKAGGGIVAVPTSTLSKRLDSPTVPADSLAQNQITADGRKYPRLLRRKPGSQLTDESGELFAAASRTDASMPGSLRSGKGSSTQTVPPRGIVRPTALGMMAGNILYSPTPVYPAEASAAHVQGQVRVQAQVDRDGNVTWARVVSGPPLLRDAALNAVQHWRYRPNLAHGKATPASAEAVLDFELP